MYKTPDRDRFLLQCSLLVSLAQTAGSPFLGMNLSIFAGQPLRAGEAAEAELHAVCGKPVLLHHRGAGARALLQERRRQEDHHRPRQSQEDRLWLCFVKYPFSSEPEDVKCCCVILTRESKAFPLPVLSTL